MSGRGTKTNAFVGPSEMHALIGAHDWSTTPVGPPETWPQSLVVLVKTLLASRYPMLLLWGPDLIQFYNDAYAALIGDKHPAALGISVRVTLAEAWDTLGPMLQRVMATGEANWTPSLMLLLERAGYREESYFSVSHSPVEDDAGQVTGVLAVCSEVTQQLLGERRLRLLRDLAAKAGETQTVETTCRELLAAIAEHPLDVPFAEIYLRDRDPRTLVLRGAVGLPEGSPERVAIDEDAASPLARAAAGEASTSDDVPRRAAVLGGPFRDPVQCAWTLPIAASGRAPPLGVLVAGVSPNRALDEGYRSFYELLAGQVSMAIRNARAYEDERRRAEALAEIDRAKTAFFSNVSHELRTPLTLILAPVEDAVAHAQGALAGEGLLTVHRSALRLLRLVNTLLDFSRIEAGRLTAAFEPTCLATLTADLASSFRSVVERAGLTLTIDCPPLAEPVYVDRAQWEKIVLNLLSNAFKFTLEGAIEVTLRARPGAVELCVRDTGAGIPADEVPRVFDRFYRVQGARGRSFEGTGIGLALVKELVELHHGSIHASSVEGKGSTFTVTIPTGAAHLAGDRLHPERELTTTEGARAYALEAAQWLTEGGAPGPAAEAHAIEAAPSNSQSEDRQSPAAGGRVLVVDDNADMRSYLVRLLGPRFDVEAAADGEAALAMVRARPPDLVLSDVMMPRLDGFGLLRALRDDPATRAIPIVLLSARGEEGSVLEGLETGADDYLVKPFSGRELVTRVRTHLEMARVRRGAAEAVRHRRWIESVLDLMPTPLLLVEPGTASVTFANAAAARLAGGHLPSDGADGHDGEGPVFTDRDGRPIPHDEQPIARAARGERLADFEVDLRTKAETRALLASSDMLPAMHDHPGTAVVVFQEVTKLRRVETELEQAVRARDEFLSIASHELKTPLTPLQVQLRTLRRRAPQLVPNEQDAEWLVTRLTTLQRQGERLGRLVNQLLDVSRVVDRQPHLDLEHVDLGEVVHDALRDFTDGGVVQRAGSRIVVRTGGDVIGWWDRARVERIVSSLLDNALKFGAGQPVEIALSSDGATATLAITDQGIGIAADDRARIFGRFERAVPERHFTGLGLGLWIAAQAAEAMGGQIEVSSRPQQGSTFTVRLPLAGPSEQRDDGDGAAPHARATGRGGARPTGAES